jgi:cell filamentation protein
VLPGTRSHRHLFQDLYDWTGKFRVVNIAKGDHMFCLVPYIPAQMAQRFAGIRAENGLRGLSRVVFAGRAAEHICEINAIHPFRDGNGRALRAFAEILAARAGHSVRLERIDPRAWTEASIRSFQDANYGPMRQVIERALAEPGEAISR